MPANPKDVPFAIFYFLSLISMYKFSPSKEPAKLLLLGLLFGITQSLRTVGFTLYLIYFIYELYIRKPIKDIILSGLLVFIIAGFFMASTWAYTGANYIRNTAELFTNASDFTPWNNTMLFQGNFLLKYERPIQYLPIWFLLTTPLYVLGGSFLSLLYIKKSKLLFITWSALVINGILYVLMNPVIYNGLRHFLYLLPILVLNTLIFMYETLNVNFVNKYIKGLMLGLVAINITLTGVTMFKLHPYEYTYFNELVGGIKGAQGRYEMDYWGASYTQAAAWLREQEYSKIYPCNL